MSNATEIPPLTALLEALGRPLTHAQIATIVGANLKGWTSLCWRPGWLTEPIGDDDIADAMLPVFEAAADSPSTVIDEPLRWLKSVARKTQRTNNKAEARYVTAPEDINGEAWLDQVAESVSDEPGVLSGEERRIDKLVREATADFSSGELAVAEVMDDLRDVCELLLRDREDGNLSLRDLKARLKKAAKLFIREYNSLDEVTKTLGLAPQVPPVSHRLAVVDPLEVRRVS